MTYKLGIARRYDGMDNDWQPCEMWITIENVHSPQIAYEPIRDSHGNEDGLFNLPVGKQRNWISTPPSGRHLKHINADGETLYLDLEGFGL